MGSDPIIFNRPISLLMRPLITLFLLTSALSAETVADRKVVLGLVDTCAQAPKTYEAEGFKPDGAVRAIFYDALTWQGKPTRVFAWIGLPSKREYPRGQHHF